MSLTLRLVVLASLYLAQGLPYGFFTQALPVILREQGASLTLISATGLLYLPWMLKFLWAPWVDRGQQRKRWIVPLQLLAAGLAALLMALLPAEGALRWVLVGVLCFNLLAAMQDVATDGLAVRMLSGAQRGWGNGIQVGAYRIGMILGGGWLLAVFAQAGWAGSFGFMALLLLGSVVPILFLRETAIAPAAVSEVASPTRWRERLLMPGMLPFIGLVCLYKFGDSLGAAQVGPLLHDQGFSKTDIAWIKGTLGSVCSLVGAALGGWYAARQGRRRALWVCGLLQTASLMLYAVAVWQATEPSLFVIACIAEHLLGGMATVALFAVMMDATDPHHASTDYSLLACASVLAMGLAGFTGGVIGDALGYVALFIASVILSGLGTWVFVRMVDRGHAPVTLRSSWRPLRA